LNPIAGNRNDIFDGEIVPIDQHIFS